MWESTRRPRKRARRSRWSITAHGPSSRSLRSRSAGQTARALPAVLALPSSKERAVILAAIVRELAAAGQDTHALQLATRELSSYPDLLTEVAEAFAAAGKRVAFQALLPLLGMDPRSACAAVECLAHLFPAQAPRLVEVLLQEEASGEGSPAAAGREA
jgi:hypothetical protein